jgi:PAS domain S-box-containing protein
MSHQPKWLQALGDTTDGVFVVDSRQRIILWNKGAEKLLGYAEPEVLNQYCYRVIAGRRCDKAWCHANCQIQRQVLRGVLPHDYDLLTRTKQGKDIWVNVSIVAARRKTRRLTAHLLRDVTQRKRKEQEVEHILDSFGRAASAKGKERKGQGTVQSAGRYGELLSTLTRREIEILSLLAQGCSSNSIAKRLGVSRYTVRCHIQNALRKLGLHSRAEAVSFAYRNGLL